MFWEGGGFINGNVDFLRVLNRTRGGFIHGNGLGPPLLGTARRDHSAPPPSDAGLPLLSHFPF